MTDLGAVIVKREMSVSPDGLIVLPASSFTQCGFTLCFPLKDGVVLGADTRATEGMVVADKNCSKIHYISANI